MSTAPPGSILNALDQIEIVTDAWLWPRHIPLGAITTLIGDGGTFPDGSPAP